MKLSCVKSHGHREGGFSLLEVMVALAVLAVALVAISSAQHSSIHNAMRVYRGQLAAMLMRGIVLDIEQEYMEDGFPENSLEDRRCEVPREFSDIYKCRYDLVRMNLEPSEISALIDQSFGGLLGDGGLGSVAAGGDMSRTMESVISGDSALGGQVDVSQLAFLLPLFGPEGPAIMDLCGINLNGIMMGFMGMQAIAPMIMEEVGNRTRKLTVRLEWQDGPLGKRDFSITTFISALPEEELRKLKELEDTRDVIDQVAPGLIPGSSPGGRQ